MKMLPSLLCVLSLLFIGVCDAGTVGMKTRFYENGHKRSEVNYKDGERHGLGTWWYVNGQKRFEASYKQHRAHGLMTEWDIDGNITSQTRFENGKKVE